METKLVIAVQNSANCGKTTTLRYLMDLIKIKYEEKITIIREIEIYNNNNDFIFDFSVNNLKFSILSEGDVGGKVSENLDKLENSDIIICTTRTKGSTVEAVKNFRNKYKAKLIWSRTYTVDKEIKKNNESIKEANMLKAEHLLKLLQDQNLL